MRALGVALALGVSAWSLSLRAEPRMAAAGADASESAPAPIESSSGGWGELARDPTPNLWVPTWHSLGLMTGMRLTEAWLWPDPFAETRLDRIGAHYQEAFTRPPKWDSRADAFEWDGDPWWINAVGHAVFGAELYYRPRACGQGVLTAVTVATVGTVVWDYGFEASGVRPSGVDLWYTPLSGALLGEIRYQGYLWTRGIRSQTLRTVVQTLLDPFGQIERALGAPC